MTEFTGDPYRVHYTRVAILLHWLIAALLVAMAVSGWWMSGAITDPSRQALAYQVFQLHKSAGFLVLALTLFRIGWRLGHPAPPLPAAMPRGERLVAAAVHAGFYTLLIAIPLSGWLYVSAGWAAATDRPLDVPTIWFGLVRIPHLFDLVRSADTVRRTVGLTAVHVHGLLVWGACALTALHVAAALKHHFVDWDHVLASMIPNIRHRKVEVEQDQPPGLRAARLGGVLAVVLSTVALAVWARPAPRIESGANGSQPVAAAPRPVETRITPGRAQAWEVDHAASKIGFAGKMSEGKYAGEFATWQAWIWFDPNDLSGSKVVVTIDTGSARTGDATQDSTLRGAEWFNPALFGTARFEATTFAVAGGNRYDAIGTLRIKDRAVPAKLRFSLVIAGRDAKATGGLTVDRADIDLGMSSDPSGNWIARKVDITVTVAARR